MAMTLDGHVAHPTLPWEFGSREDRRRMDRLREWADCVIVSRKTIEHDNPDMRVRTKPHIQRHPKVIIIMQRAVPIRKSLRVAQFSSNPGEVWIQNATHLASIHEIFPDAPAGWALRHFQSVTEIIEKLESAGHSKILIEGGPTLNGLFFEAGLIDEVHLTLLPLLWGGHSSDRIVMTKNVLPFQRFRVQRVERRGNEVFFRYVRN